MLYEKANGEYISQIFVLDIHLHNRIHYYPVDTLYLDYWVTWAYYSNLFANYVNFTQSAYGNEAAFSLFKWFERNFSIQLTAYYPPNLLHLTNMFKSSS